MATNYFRRRVFNYSAESVIDKSLLALILAIVGTVLYFSPGYGIEPFMYTTF